MLSEVARNPIIIYADLSYLTKMKIDPWKIWSLAQRGDINFIIIWIAKMFLRYRINIFFSFIKEPRI